MQKERVHGLYKNIFKKQSMETIPEETQTLNLIAPLKLAILDVFKEQTMSKKLKENMRVISHQIKNTNKKIKII